MVTFDINKLREQLGQLRSLPNLKEVIALRKRLNKEISKIEVKKIPKLKVITPKISRGEKISKGLKKHFRYLRLIRNNFPELTFAELRKQFSKKRKGLESDIPDAVWQNPSP